MADASKNDETPIPNKYAQYAADIASAWGPLFSKAAVAYMHDSGEGLNALQDFCALFAMPVHVVLQDAMGKELEVAVGHDEKGDPHVDMTWQDFASVAFADLKAQDYAKSESVCLGVLGNRMILEVSRFNTADEVYMTAVTLLEMNEKGKVIALEAFTDIANQAGLEKIQDKTAAG